MSDTEDRGGVLAVQENRLLILPDLQDVERDLDAVEAFKKAVQNRMVKDTDYGTIPGTPKPTLYQPGAQKVCELMKLRPRFEAVRIVEDWDRPLFYYSYRCVLVNIPTGYEVSECIGSCNSLESKYRWRYLDRRCPRCGKDTIRRSRQEYGGGWYCARRSGGCGSNFPPGDQSVESQPLGKVPNDDVFSQINTMDKMAQKRSLVGAALFVGRLSDVFTQDLEDMDIRSIPTDERMEDDLAKMSHEPGTAHQAPRNGNAARRPQERCPKHNRVWASGPNKRIGHPNGDEWCWRDEQESPSEPAEEDDDLLVRIGRKLKEEGVDWSDFKKFLGVEEWAQWEKRYDDGATAGQVRKAAITAAWSLYEEDKTQRAKGCARCGQQADVIGNLWCRACISGEGAGEETES